VVIERDWIVVMSQVADRNRQHEGSENNNGGEENSCATASNPTWLSETNVVLRQIDLSCRVAAPAVAGFILGAAAGNGGDQKSDLAGAALLVGVVNALALAVEYYCTAQIYQLIPALSVKHSLASLYRNRDAMASKFGCNIWKLPSGLELYLKQRISWAGIGLSML
jgi:Ferroportin1 (FPN1)